MLLYSTRTAVFKNGDKSVLLCRITLPSGAEDEKLNSAIVRFYSEIYEATYASARDCAARMDPPDGRLATLTVTCTHNVKKGAIIVYRSYKITQSGKTLKERQFTDKFSENVIKQRNIP